MSTPRPRAALQQPAWHVCDQDPFLSTERLPAGFDPADVSRYGDDRWDLTPLQQSNEVGAALCMTWSTFPDPLRESFRRAGWALINLSTPEDLLARAHTARVKWPSPSTQAHTVVRWRALALWLQARGVFSLTDVDLDHLTDYALHVSARSSTQHRAAPGLYACTQLWGFGPHLLPQDRLVMPPWEAGDIKDFVPNEAGRAENQTEPIHPAVMSPLLIWAIRFVEDFADDILAAWDEYQSIAARIIPMPGGRANPQARQPLLDRLAWHRSHGVPLPGSSSYGIVGVANAYIAALHRTTTDHVARLVIQYAGDLPVSTQTPLAAPITGMLHGQPWKKHINYHEAAVLMRRLNAACLVVLAYLSGPRPGEVLQLKVGCCPEPEDDGTGSIHYELHGNFYKDAYDESGRLLPQGLPRDIPWTTILPGVHAVRVLERMATSTFLFRAGDPRSRERANGSRTGKSIGTLTAMKRIASFVDWVNAYTIEADRPSECIPPDPDGTIALGRFRRTLAWHIARLPGGRVALAIQYGHLRSMVVSEGYSSRGRSGLAKAMDIETAMAIADFLHEAGERADQGEGVSGPAVQRMIGAIRDARIRFNGKFLTPLQVKDLLEEPRFQVFDSPEAFLTCNYDPGKALCHEEGSRKGSSNLAPAVDRCDPACVNIARTDQHITALRAEIVKLTAEAADPLTPLPLAARILQRVARLTGLIERHNATRIVPGRGTSDDS